MTLDALGNALKARGVPPAHRIPAAHHPLRLLKGLEGAPRGTVRLVDTGRSEAPPDAGVRDAGPRESQGELSRV